MKFYLDGTEYENPHMWETLQERFYLSDVIGGYLLEVTGSVEWGGGAYQYLRGLFLSGICQTINVRITDSCADGNEKKIFDGLIFISDVEFDLNRCVAIVEFVDNSFICKIDNNKSIKCFLGVNRSKNDVDITAFSNATTSIILRSKTNVNDITTGTAYRIFDAFTFLIAFMTDGTVNFVSDYFDPAGPGLDDTAKYTVLINGQEIRTGAANNLAYISYEDFYNDINKIFNIAFSVENTTGTPTVRIEPKSYYKQSSVVNYFENPAELKQRINKERLYAKVKFGSSQVATVFTYLPDVVFDGFEQEEFHLLGECNSQAILDLQLSELITDTNIIQDVLPSGTGNTSYDDSNFLIVLDSSNVNESYVTIGATTYYYNKPFTNYNVSVYWFGGIPQGIAKFLGDTNDTFQASFISTTQSVLIASSPDVILFPDDSTSPNHDVNNNYNPATGRYTSPVNGFYAFELFQRFEAGIAYTTVIKRYNSANVLQETISGGFFLAPFIDGLTNVLDNPPPNNTDIFEKTYTFGFQMTATDYIEIEATPYYATNATILQGTYWKCVYAVTGGGIVQEYNSTDMDLVQNNFNQNISCDMWNAIKLSPFETHTITYPDGVIGGWISEIQRTISTGQAEVFINSKPIA
jgi:hypothetical protein